MPRPVGTSPVTFRQAQDGSPTLSCKRERGEAVIAPKQMGEDVYGGRGYAAITATERGEQNSRKA